MERYFEDGKEIAYFHDVDSLIEVVKKYLADDAFPTRSEIANNLYNKVLAKHTWDTTVQKIIEVAEI
jgi:spore maturation protein CgeB